MTDPPRPDFLELADYTSVLRRRGWVALALAGLGALVSVIYLAVAPASYQATADVYVTPNSANQNVVLGSKGTSTAVNMDNEAQIVESNTVAVLAARALHSRIPPQALLGQVSVSVPAKTTVLAIPRSASSPGSAAGCAQELRMLPALRASVLPRRLRRMFRKHSATISRCNFFVLLQTP